MYLPPRYKKPQIPCCTIWAISRVVMLGEATHGTHEFYSWRAAISQRLIAEKGFRFIAVEGDLAETVTASIVL